ncbi:class I SAM-dependent methyltransferase [Qipengyuania sp. ASV99]|uniref:class I SAM-dependent methyltransferase n=1 Tax=Qipengyuania sp. ASV99 TaxID=3399681 RepID=UPI003A4C5F40
MNATNFDKSEIARQKELFEAIHEKYSEATTDRYAEAYKEEFLYGPILAELQDAATLMELASGVGSASGWMRDHHPGLEISGCDISESACNEFTERHNRPCYLWDVTKPVEAKETYDAVLVMGGIHHLVADLPMAFENIAKMLNPGGKLIMAEPNADFILEPVRKLWYKIDTGNFDAENEHALSHPKLVRDHAQGMTPGTVRYIGGPAYFLLLQNWVLRVPNGAKKFMAPALMTLERAYHRLPGKFPFSTFVACWQKS